MVRPAEVTERRTLRFERMRDLLDDVETLDQDPPALRASGNWTPAQNIRHVTYFIDASIDGFSFKAPLLLRVLVGLAKKKFLARPIKPGLKLPANMAEAIPPADTQWSDAVAGLRNAIGRVDAGERMTKPSPAFGELTHEQWEQLHCRHAELHWSFILSSAP